MIAKLESGYSRQERYMYLVIYGPRSKRVMFTAKIKNISWLNMAKKPYIKKRIESEQGIDTLFFIFSTSNKSIPQIFIIFNSGTVVYLENKGNASKKFILGTLLASIFVV